MFRRHVWNRAAKRKICFDDAVTSALVRNVKVQQTRLPIKGDKYVGRLDVRMHNTIAMRVRERIGQLRTDPADRIDIATMTKVLRSR